MNLTLSRQNLQRGLAAVSASIPSRTTLPVLSNLLLETEETTLRVSGTDLDIAVRVRIPADIATPGSLTVPGKKFQEIVRELPDQPVQISTRGEQVEIRCGRSVFKLNGMSAAEFPALPAVDFTAGWQVGGAELQALIQSTSFAVSTEESRPILNGVLWELRDGSMRMVATNGHRLARRGVTAGRSTATSADFIVPPAALQQVLRLYPTDATIQVSRSGNHLGFHSAGSEVYTRLIEGTYPNYEQVIPRDNDRRVVVDRQLLESSVRRMATVASDQTHRIRLHLEDARMRLSVLTPDLGEGEDEVEIEYGGEAMEIGFNANYLLEILRSMPTREVVLSFKGPERAVMIEPSGTDGADYLCIVMPLRLLD